MKNSTVLAAAMAMGLAFHAQAKTYTTPVFTEDFENTETWHDNVQYGSVSNAYFNMATLNLGGTDYQLSQAERTLADGVTTTKFYQQASDNNQKRNSAFIIPDSALNGLGNDYMLEFDLGFNAPYARNSSTDYRAGLSVNDANGLPLLTIGTVYGNGNGEKTTGYIYRGDDINEAIASNFRVTGRDGVITNSAYAKNWLHVKLAVSGSSMSVTATLADGTVLCSDAAVSTGITSPVKYLGLRSWNNGTYNLARCGLDNISMSKAIEGTFVWTGEAGDGRWSNPGNWQISGLAVASAPGAGDAVSISDATVVIDPDFDLSSVTATLSNAKIGLMFTDNALAFTIPSGMAETDFVVAGPYTMEESQGVLTATRVASTFTWAGGASGEWTDAENWTVGGASVATLPNDDDTASFVSTADVVVSSAARAGCVSIADSLTLSGESSLSTTNITATGNGILHAAGITITSPTTKGKHTYINSPVEVVAGTTNTFTVGKHNDGYKYIFFNGNLSGSGVLRLDQQKTSGLASGRFSGDNSEFSGEIAVVNQTNRDITDFTGAASTSSNAVYTVYGRDDRKGSMFASSGTTYFIGALNGTVYQQSANGSGPSGVVLEIGGRNEDCAFAGNLSVYANGRTAIRKVGTAKLTCSASEIGNVEIAGGTYEVTADTQSGYIKFTGDGVFRSTPEASASSEIDYAKKFVGSTDFPIVFDDGDTNRTWSSAIPASNTAGFTKLGAGTLTLSAAPLYTGWTTVKAGKLVVPVGTELDVVAGAGGEIEGATTNNLKFAADYTLAAGTESFAATGTADVSDLTVYIANPASAESITIVRAGSITGTARLEFPAGTSEKVKAKWSLRSGNGTLKASSVVPFAIIVR